MMNFRLSLQIAVLALGALTQVCSSPEAAGRPAATPPQLGTQTAVVAKSTTSPAQALPPGEPLLIRFDVFSLQLGLTLSITVVGDSDGKTTFSNQSFFNYQAPQYARDVRVVSDGGPLPVTQNKKGWTVNHAPHAQLTVSYRLAPSEPTTIDAGVSEWVRPEVGNGLFHLIGDTAWLLPTGRAGTDTVALSIDATRVADDQHFVSSFAPGATLRAAQVTRRQLGHAVYLGGAISLSVRDTPAGSIGVVYSAMDSTVRADDLRNDAIAVLEAERRFLSDSQPWYLVSVHGGPRGNPEVKLGGGTGLTHSFVMFVTPGLDFANPEDREQFRWVLAHEYFHLWNGQAIRVANLPQRDQDDTSVYWFSEGFTEFYAMRLLTRAGLQSPRRALDVLDDKLTRYAHNSKRHLSAKAVGPLYYSDADADQIPYLRGYLAAWQVDIAMRRSSGGSRSLDDAMLALVKRAKAEPDFRVDNLFLASYLTEGLPVRDVATLRRFIISGGASPLGAASFSPCLQGAQESSDRQKVWQFQFIDKSNDSCFRH